jgi:uncharacterized protein YjiS (DUF1127 family)
MGKKLISNDLHFVSLTPFNGSFVASLSLADLLSISSAHQVALKKVEKTYNKWIKRMTLLLVKISHFRESRAFIPARTVWELGDAIFGLQRELQNTGVELDGLYDHLIRDLGVKRMWLKKVVIFRRYLPFVDLIPKVVNWGPCSKAPKSSALKLLVSAEKGHDVL